MVIVKHGAFGHRIRETLGHADQRDDGGHVQNDAAALPNHHRHRRPAAQVHALDVHAVQPVEILFRRLLDGADVRDASIIDQDVDPPVFLDDVDRTTALTRALSATSQAAAAALPPAAGNRRRRFGRRPLLEIEHNEVRALTREGRRNGPTNARAAAGDDGDFPCQIEHDVAGVKYYTLTVKSTICADFIGKVSG